MTPHPSAHEWFAEFWAAYFRKVAKADALRAFLKICTSVEMKDRIVAAVIAQSPMMLARDPEHRPHAGTWLRGARWEDEIDQPQAKPARILTGHELFMARKQIEAREYEERQAMFRKQREEYAAKDERVQ